jgi:hypothetical protein
VSVPLPATRPPERNRPLRVVGKVLGHLIAGGLNTVALLFAVFLWYVWLTGSFRTDHDVNENGGILLILLAYVAGGAALVALLVTGVAAVLRLMPRWLLIPPGLLLVATLVAAAGMSEVYGQGL